LPRLSVRLNKARIISSSLYRKSREIVMQLSRKSLLYKLLWTMKNSKMRLKKANFKTKSNIFSKSWHKKKKHAKKKLKKLKMPSSNVKK